MIKKRNPVARLTHRIIFLRNLANDESEDENWQEFCSSFAEIKPICDNRFISLEGIDFGNVITEAFFIFRTRFTKDIKPSMRIKFRNRVFEIKRVINIDEKDRALNIIGLEI